MKRKAGYIFMLLALVLSLLLLWQLVQLSNGAAGASDEPVPLTLFRPDRAFMKPVLLLAGVVVLFRIGRKLAIPPTE